MTNKTHTPNHYMSAAVLAVYEACKGSSTKELKECYRQLHAARYIDRPEATAVRSGIYRLLEDRLGIEKADQFGDEVFAWACSQS